MHVFILHRSPLKNYKQSVYYRKGIVSMKNIYIIFFMAIAGVIAGVFLMQKYVVPHVEGYDNKELVGSLGGVGVALIPMLIYGILFKLRNRRIFLQRVYADTPSKKWQLAVSGIYTLLNGVRWDENKKINSFERLDMGHITINDRNKYRRILSEWWSVTGHESAISTLNWLLHQGHRQEFEYIQNLLKTKTANDIFELLKNLKQYQKSPQLLRQRIKAVQEAGNGYSQAGIIAWDLVRLGYVVKMAYCSDYINSREAWSYLLKAAQITQNTFSSWKEMMESWQQGRYFWGHDLKAHFKPQIDKLLYEAESPWQKLMWRTQLV